MKAPLSWIREHVELPGEITVEQLTARLTELGLKLEAIESPGAEIEGPLVVGRVLTQEKEPQKNGKTINWCTVDVGDANGTGEPQGIVCGAHNFGPGDLVVVVLPGAVLPGGFAISARKTYGHVSAGMICSAAEVGLPETALGSGDGIIVLPEGSGEPGDDVRAVLGLDEQVIEFEINPDRAYALSLRGIAREAALGFDLAFDDPARRAVPAADDAGHPVVIDDPEGCPVFVVRTVSGFDPAAPTPEWMAARLTQAGMRPVSLAVDVTNYVMLELGRPIHAYDADRVQGALRVRRAAPGERLRTLDGTDRALDPADLVVADDSGPIGLGGVMGGESTEIGASTTRVLVESAHWHATSMFRTGRRHKITSEAGKRNERGVDPAICEAAADRVVELLTAHGSGTADAGVTVVGDVPPGAVIEAPIDLPARISGLSVDGDRVVAVLQAIGCEVERRAAADGDGGERIVVRAPTWRPDLSDPYDLVEEVARVVGYDDVPSIVPSAPPGRGLTPQQRWRRRVGRLLAGAGLVEVVDFPFVGEASFDALGLAPDDERRDAVRLANPLSSEEPLYTTTLLPNLLTTAARNLGRGAPGASVFEVATVAFPAGGGAAPILGVDRRPADAELEALLRALPHQPLHLAAVLAGEQQQPGWWGGATTASWDQPVALARALADELGVALEISSSTRAPWHPGRCAALVVEGTVVGHAGELHPGVAERFGLPRGAAALELDLDALIAAAPAVVLAPRISAYPVAKEDVALVVDASVPAAAVEAALREGAGDLLESVRLFDVYTGEGIEPGTRSLAFALRFRAADRTLAEGEATAARDAAVAHAESAVGARRR